MQGQRGVWKGVPLGEEGAGGEAGRLWQVAEGGGPGSPSARPPGKWEGVDLPLTVAFQGPLHLVLHGGRVGEPGAVGVEVAAMPAAPCPLPWALGGSAGSFELDWGPG